MVTHRGGGHGAHNLKYLAMFKCQTDIICAYYVSMALNVALHSSQKD